MIRWGVTVAVAGLALGLAARSIDFFPPPYMWELSGLVSSVGSWGLVAVVVGFVSGSRKRAALGGAAVLAIASLLYYALSFSTGNWQHQYSDLSTGEPDPAAGLIVLLRSLALWVGASVIGGPVLGMTGFIVRRGSPPASALVALGTAAVLCGERLAKLWEWRYSGPISAAPALELAVVAIGMTFLALYAFAKRGTVTPSTSTVSSNIAAGRTQSPNSP